ncbi:hypothetical protein M1413_01140 [Patescibacteria group bacterium]|jgi:hypothetical protein|nr:hypothetical protein [Patescibacteria group bacterium]
MNTAKTIFIALAAFAAVLGIAAKTSAQAANNYSAIITWRANDYYPSDFLGKALPTNGTTVSLSVIVLNNQKIQDASNLPILWYVDGNFMNGGVGESQTNFTVTKTAGDSHIVSVQIGAGGQTISASARIPVVNYRAVINAPYPAQTVNQNSTANLEIIPYFFNVNSFNDFLFSWTVNNLQNVTSTTDNTLSLKVGQIGATQNISIDASVQNTANAFEFAYGKTNLYVQ